MSSERDEPVYLHDHFNRMTDEWFRSNVGTAIYSEDTPLDQKQQECVMLSRSGDRSYLCNQCPFEESELVTLFCHIPDSVGDGFNLMYVKNKNTVARLPSSRTPRLMNSLIIFVPGSIVTLIAIKNQYANLSKFLDKNACAVVQIIQQQKSNSSYLFDNKCDTLGYDYKRCDYTSIILEQMRAHYDNSSEFEDMRNRLNPDVDLMKQIGEPQIFLLKRSAHEEESILLIDKINMHPQLSNKQLKGHL
ncbi:hypothetical protein GJ496_003486 [Pomphorhynchus laevis]|nr:hypothetical protein GJ496_003486 [Pomphorhynchus laevis]